MASVPPKQGSDRVWTAFLAFMGVAIAVIVGRLIAPTAVPLRSPPPARPPSPTTTASKPIDIPATWQGKPISAWRRAYILKHGHQPPAPK